uniref:SRR1-like domain-containing protein n=1 Tax=Vombatus ursinus TaxID=29139 RepID=A0A4X2KT71_VOMUR
MAPISEALEHLHLEPSQHPVEAPNSNLKEDSLKRTSHFKCVCYGIGKFASCLIARNQLAFLLLFLEKLQIPRNHCYIFDPLFNEVEISVLNTLGLTVLEENEVINKDSTERLPLCGKDSPKVTQPGTRDRILNHVSTMGPRTAGASFGAGRVPVYGAVKEEPIWLVSALLPLWRP